MFARVQALQGLRRVHLRGRGQDDGVQPGHGQAVGQIGAGMGDAVPGGHFLRLVEFTPDQRDHLDAVDALAGVQVLLAEGTGTRQRDLDGFRHVFSSTRWPTAVLLAGT